MRALRLTGWKQEPELVEVADPLPGPGQVVIRVGGAGVCHSDLHIMADFDGSTGLPWPLPFTLGHENAGWVHALGSGVTGWEVGQAVTVHGAWGCGGCARCRAGVENYCEDPFSAPVPGGGGGLGMDGGMADFLLVPDARHLVALPAGLEPRLAAPLTDAGLTPYHAIRRSWPKLDPAATAVVIGVGGLGHMAIQILRATTAARIVAVDPREAARRLATDLGADEAIESGESAATAIRTMTSGRGADVVLDFVGSDDTLRTAVAATRMMGDLTVVGIAGGTLPVGFFTVPYEVSVQTVYWGTHSELVEVLELGARGLLTPKVTTYPLDSALDAYRDLAAGGVEGRAVVVPATEP